ncbi:C40 family peptidase [Neobacillus dielmonensis]|uniref:C40 family peptidase n=1 Tax=Neobacillus dielmonensis TaxID=1347369 RepID=UPI000694AA0D|nr:C40 family peptidase [Neobacillus dielmonensis]
MIKKSFFKYTVSAAILATMIQLSVTPAFADKVTEEQINASKAQVDDFETKVQQLDNQISLAMEQSQKLSGQIESQQVKIQETEAEIEQAKKELDVHKQVYAERLKSIQSEGKQSVATYAEILFTSTDLSEFLTRFTAISKIIQNDTDLLQGLKDKQEALDSAEEKLHTELHQLEQSKSELAVEQQKIEANKQELNQALQEAQAKLDSQESQLAAQQEAERQAQLAQQRAQEEAENQARLAAQSQSAAPAQSTTSAQPAAKASAGKTVSAPAPTVTAVSPASPEAASKVIAYAKQFLGVPYVWGGSTPSGFDCSGFTSYVFRNSVGISLPRVSRDQQNFGTRIPLSQVQPGDLVFRGSPAYHVGIYIGGGQYIHAPQTGDVVKIASFNPSKFTSASRVLH